MQNSRDTTQTTSTRFRLISAINIPIEYHFACGGRCYGRRRREYVFVSSERCIINVFITMSTSIGCSLSLSAEHSNHINTLHPSTAPPPIAPAHQLSYAPVFP